MNFPDPRRLHREHPLGLGTAVFFLMLAIPSLCVSADGASKSLYAFLILLALLNRGRALFLVFLPFFLLTPIAIYYAVFYRMPTDVSFWFTIFGSSVTEAGDYVRNGRYLVFAAMVVPYLIAAAFCFRLMRGRYFAPGSRWRLTMLALILIPLSYIPRNANARDYALDMYRHFRKAYPQNLLLGYMAADLEVGKLRDMIRQSPSLHPVLDPVAAAMPATYVVVIGESARRDRWHAYGYPLADTPVVDSRPDILLFKDMVSYGFVTTDSVPYMLSKSSNGHMNPSFLSAFRQAGFKVSWLSNQARYGEFDTLISAYASEADNIRFLNSHSYSMNYQDSFDERLLPAFRDALADPAPRKLIVLHLYGSHPDFDKRYPPAMAHFPQPYDNSIFYTDHLLGRMLDMTGRQSGLAALMYVSDHGLNLGDCPNVTGHIDFTPSFQVPFLIWTNPAWRQARPRQQSALQDHRALPVHTGDILDTLTDMAGIRFDGQNPAQSLAGDYRPHVRLVKSASGDIDFDHSRTGPDCHLHPAP